MGNYLEGKLARNADLDYDEYVDKFMKHYYGNAAATMKKLFNDTMTHFNYAVYELGMPNRKPVPSATYWPFAVVSGLRSLIDQALDDIDYLKELDSERYAVLRDRILLEGLAYDYLLIELHPAYYTEDQLLQMKLTFRETASRLNLTMRAEGILITDLYESWGI